VGRAGSAVKTRVNRGDCVSERSGDIEDHGVAGGSAGLFLHQLCEEEVMG